MQSQREGRDGGFSTDVCDVVNCYRCRVVRVLALPEGRTKMSIFNDGFIFVYAFSLWGLWAVLIRKPKKKVMTDYHEPGSWKKG